MQSLLKSKSIRPLLLVGLMLTLAAPRALAWGRTGHRLVALVAEQYLTPEAKAQITELLHRETLADVASWADDYRTQHPETGPWHIVPIPSTQAAYNRDRDCPLPKTDPASPWRDCIVDRILEFEAQLANTSLPANERATALKFLVHFIGDIHQPLHTLGEARGGNELRVNFLGSSQCGDGPCNLHEIWDDEIIKDEHLQDKKFVDKLTAEIDANHWHRFEGGDPAAWANVSHHYAINALAPNGAMLGRPYVTDQAKVVDAQLALAGLRLAHVLNNILAAPSPESQPGRTPLPRPDADAPPKP